MYILRRIYENLKYNGHFSVYNVLRKQGDLAIRVGKGTGSSAPVIQ